MATFYRYTDAVRNPNEVKDMQLNGTYGDLSDGTSSLIKMNPGITDSNIGLFQFPIAAKYNFGNPGIVTGFSMKFKSIADDVDDIANQQGTKTFGLHNVYLHKKDAAFEGAKEGDVQQIGENYPGTMNQQFAASPTASWIPLDLMAYLTSMDYAFPYYHGFYEDFEGTSDVDTSIDVTQGAVRKKGDPYITLDVAHDSVARQAAGVRLSKLELSLFYGTTFKGQKIIKLKKNGKKWGPLQKKGIGGMGPAFGAATGFGGDGGAVQSTNVTGQALAAAAGTPGELAGYGGGKTVYATDVSQGRKYAGKPTQKTLAAAKASRPMQYFDKATGGVFRQASGVGGKVSGGKLASVTTGSKVLGKHVMRKVPVVGTVITLASAGAHFKKRASALKDAEATGDVSGLARPMRDPVWYSKASWKNAHVGEKGIEGKIQYSYETVLNPLEQKDSQAITTTSTWWDNVRERTDYPKSEVTTSGKEIAYVGNEDMAAKTSINFSTNNSISGQSMEMRAYCDYDANSLPRNQENMTFNTPSGSEQQDIFVTKRLPCPKTMFADKTGAAGMVTADTGNKWELSLDMNIVNGWTPYTYDYHSGSLLRNSLRRTIAITFGTLKPEDNDDLQSYIARHTDGAGTFTAGQKLTGVFFMPSMSFANATPTDIHINPMSTLAWNGSAVTNENLLQYGESSYLSDQLLQSSTTNGSYGSKFPTGKYVRLKFSASPLGASGMIANDDGSGDTELGNEAKNQGRLWLTLHDPETDDVLDVQDADDSDNYGFGTTKKGPMVLSAFNDPINAYDNQSSNYRYAHNLGFHDGREADGAGAGDGEPDDHAIWTPHFTIWVCNHRWNSTASPSFTNTKKGSDNTSANNVFKHDVFQKAILKQDNAVSTNALVPDTYYPNATFSDMRINVDQIALKGVEPDVINMSVNNENMSSGQENMFNKKNSKYPKYYDGVNSNFYQDALGTPSFSTDQKNIKTMRNLPTILSLGFTKMGGTNWNANTVDEGSGNTGAASTSKPTFLLLNDFVCGKAIPTAIPDANLAAMYTSAAEKDRLCGDPIDLLGKLGSSTSKNPFNSTGDGNMTIGNVAGRDIVTGNAEPDVWDRNRSTSHKMYANNFQNKGFLQFQKDLLDTGTYSTGDQGWIRRENIYASTHVIKATDITDKQATLTVSQADVLYRNTITDDDLTTGHDLFILYQYGRPLSFENGVAGVDGKNMGTCAVGTIERDENQITFTKVTLHDSQDNNDEWTGYTATHDGKGGDLSVILDPKNMPRVMISPYRRWICIQMGLGPNGAATSDEEALEDLVPRGYGSITPVKRPRVAGTDSTYGGFAMGPTFNESRWYVNTSDQNPYYAKSSFDIQDTENAYHTDIDFGFGAYDTETGAGGQVFNFRPDYSRNHIDFSNLLIGDADLANKAGEPISFVISPSGGGDAKENAFYMHSSNTTNNHEKPKFLTHFYDDPPNNPGMVVNPFEEDPHYPEFEFAISGDDIWHSYLMVDDKPITGKFHNMIAYAPLNENLDSWEANVTYDTAYTPSQIKCYNHFDYIGKEFIGETSASNLLGRMSYHTADGLYNGSGVSNAWIYTDDSCEGLDGHAKMGGGQFLYGLQPSQTDTGYLPNTKADYRKHFTAQGIFTFNSAMSTNNYTMMAHGADTAPHWMVYYDGTNKQIVARAYWSDTGYVELKSTTAPLLDDVTPMHVAIVLDTELLESNFKLYINGNLEDQTGKALATGTTNNWDYGELLLHTSNSTLVIGMPMGAVPEGSLSTIEWTGKVEEVIVHKCPLYFFPDGTDKFVYTKELEEVTDSLTGETKPYHAKLFTMDYHNIRDPVAQSRNQSWKIPSFNIDGT